MCTAGTATGIGNVGVGMMALGMLSSANAAKESAHASQINLRYQAGMDEINARLDESNAEAALIAGQREAVNSGLKTGALKSAQRVAMAANGLDLGSDTAVNILTSTDVMGEIDKNQIESNAIRAAWGYRTSAGNSRNSAAMKRVTASGINPDMAWNTSLVAGAGSVATSWYTVNKGMSMSKE
jgi:hypothetical protein